MSQHPSSDAPDPHDPDDFALWEASPQESPPTPTCAQEPADVVSAACREEAAASFASNRDKRSFEILYRAAERKILDVVRSSGVDNNDVEDVVSTAFVTVWRNRASIQGSAYKQFLAFAVKTAKRKAIDWHRSHGWWNNNALLADDPDEHRVGDDDQDCKATSVDEIAAAREAMRKLTPEQCEVVEAKAAGLTWEEIAKAMGLKVGAVRRIYDAAMRRLGIEG